jgi:hypothetical protein
MKSGLTLKVPVMATADGLPRRLPIANKDAASGTSHDLTHASVFVFDHRAGAEAHLYFAQL